MEPLLPLCGPQSVLTWAGARTTEVQHDGAVRPWRLPYSDAALYQSAHNGAAGMFNQAGMGAGVRITFSTTSDAVELTVAVRSGVALMFDLCTPGQPVLAQKVQNDVPAPAADASPAAHLEWAETWSSYSTLRWGSLGEGEKLIELWLPHVGITKILSVAISAGTAASRYIDRRPRWTTYGSSITHCGEAHSPARTWPATCARVADLNLYCLGFGGNCHFDQLVAREIRDHPADAISLKLGINMMMTHSTRTFIPAAIGFIRTIRDGQPTTPIVVVSPIFSAARETQIAEVWRGVQGWEAREEFAFTLAKMREALEDMVRVLRTEGDANIHYRNGLELFDRPDAEAGLLPDDLHPVCMCVSAPLKIDVPAAPPLHSISLPPEFCWLSSVVACGMQRSQWPRLCARRTATATSSWDNVSPRSSSARMDGCCPADSAAASSRDL